MPADLVPYAVLQSDWAKKSRKELPRGTLPVLYDVLDTLAEDPEAFPGRTRAIDRSGRIHLYTHPSPALEITFDVVEDTRVLHLLHFAAPQVRATKPVFISYSHKDVEWLEKLKMFLRPLEERGLVRVWDDTEITPGSLWMDEIRQSLVCARVAVFLITQHFLNSVFIRQQELPVLLKKAKDGGCLVLWIAVSSSTVLDSEIAEYQAANDPEQPLDSLPESQQNRLFKKVYDHMKLAVEAV